MKMGEIELDPRVKNRVCLGILHFASVNCQKYSAELWEEIHGLEEQYRKRYKTPSEALEILKPARTLYHEFGMEPTRYRPSSEALLRRIIKGKALYQINSVVDVCNYCSLYFLLPIGLYDISKIEGEIKVRVGEAGEEYEGIGKEMIHVNGRLTLTDRKGPFGNPSADSLRTAIDFSSSEILMVIFAPGGYPESNMNAHLQFARDTMLRYHPGSEIREMKLLK
ncbi:MAG: phenylalanine--tRNA ligase beta subunit-related protein [Calditrichia bacterium]